VGSALQTGCRVDDFADGRWPLWPSRADGDERLAGRNGNPRPLLRTLLGEPVTNRERSANAAFRVVLVRERGAEERDGRPADGPLHAAAEALEFRADAGVIRRDEGANILRVEPLSLRDASDDLGDDDRDHLPLLLRRRCFRRLGCGALARRPVRVRPFVRTTPGAREGCVVSEDPPLELLQLVARLEPELVHELPPRGAICL